MTGRGFPALGRRSHESGQALAVIVVLVAVLMLVPASIQMTASNQLPMSQQATFSQQALQAARAGLSDYVNWVQGHTNYPSSYCSSGVASWTCPSGKAADSTNPAFANAALASKWVYTQGSSSSSPSVAYQYLVNTSSLSSYGTGDFTVYATGRAGDPGHWVYQTIQATVQFGAPPCPGTPVTTIIPSWVTYISVTAVGAEGGGQSRTDSATVTSGSNSVGDASITSADQGKAVTGTGIPANSYVGTVTAATSFLLSSSSTSQVNVNATANGTSVTIGGVGDGGDGAELGETITNTYPVTPGTGSNPPGWGSPPYYVTLMPGSPGYSGSYHLLSFASLGGSGGCSAAGLAGGNGGGQGLGISTMLGGGGGAASALCFGQAAVCESANLTPSSIKVCNPSMQAGCMLIVAGGGGGVGGANSLGTAGGSGGWYCSANCSGGSPTWTGNGGSGSAILGLGSASGGSRGGSTSPAGGSGGIANGWNLIGALNGTGGGGGGGYLKGGGGGSAGVLGVGVGASGGGGGAGQSGVSPTPISCNTTPTASQASSSVYDANGDGIVSIQLYTGSSCSSLGSAHTWLSVLEVQQIDANAALQ
jgi:hypothetical protein